LTFVPHVSPSVLGVLAISGEVHCILNLAKILGLKEAALSEVSHQFLIFRDKDAHYGVAVDRVDGVDFVNASIQFSQRTYLKPKNSEPLVVLDGSSLFSDIISAEELRA
ncbi:MAG: hypothetical protein EOP09_04425, partial [Proteobacteria bacterium]